MTSYTLPSFNYDEAILLVFFKERRLNYFTYLTPGEGLLL